GVIVLAPLAGVFYFYIGAVPLFYASFVAGLLTISSLLVVRKTRNLVLGGNYAILILCSTLFYISWHTGAITYEGVINPSWTLNAGLILFAILLMGYFWGTVWTTVVLLEKGLVVYLYLNRYPFPNLIPYDISAYYHLGTFMVALLMILSLAFLFEKEREEALIREREKSQALRESKRYIDDVLERSPIPTFILDRAHRVVQWNLACETMTGVSAREILGNKVWDGFNIDDRGSMADMILEDAALIEEHYGDFIKSKTSSGWFELEMSLPGLKEGKRVAITAAPILDNQGMLRGAIQTIQEIKPSQIEKAKEEGGQLGPLSEAFVSPVYKVDSGGTITFWNHACEEHFGYDSSQIVGKSVFTLLSKRYRPVFKEAVAKTLGGEPSSQKALKYRNSEGKAVYVLARAFSIESADGENRECAIVNTNITALRLRLKEAEVHAAENNERLKNLTKEHDLLKKNIASMIRKKQEP
ncbi:MAG: PAS domain S-box protein, partial [Pseudomonadota bacterium]